MLNEQFGIHPFAFGNQTLFFWGKLKTFAATSFMPMSFNAFLILGSGSFAGVEEAELRFVFIYFAFLKIY